MKFIKETSSIKLQDILYFDSESECRDCIKKNHYSEHDEAKKTENGKWAIYTEIGGDYGEVKGFLGTLDGDLTALIMADIDLVNSDFESVFCYLRDTQGY